MAAGSFALVSKATLAWVIASAYSFRSNAACPSFIAVWYFCSCAFALLTKSNCRWASVLSFMAAGSFALVSNATPAWVIASA